MLIAYKMGFYDGFMRADSDSVSLSPDDKIQYAIGYKLGKAEWSKLARLSCDIEEMYTREDVDHILQEMRSI